MNEILARHAREAADRREARMKGLTDLRKKIVYGKHINIFSEEFRSSNCVPQNSKPKENLTVPGAPLLTYSRPPRFMVESMPHLRLSPVEFRPNDRRPPTYLKTTCANTNRGPQRLCRPAILKSPSVKRQHTSEKCATPTVYSNNLDAVIEEQEAEFSSKSLDSHISFKDFMKRHNSTDLNSTYLPAAEEHLLKLY